jgi:hypothetical protein
MFGNRTKNDDWEVGKATHDQDDRAKKTDEQSAFGRQGASRPRDGSLGREGAGDGQHRNDDEPTNIVSVTL